MVQRGEWGSAQLPPLVCNYTASQCLLLTSLSCALFLLNTVSKTVLEKRWENSATVSRQFLETCTLSLQTTARRAELVFSISGPGKWFWRKISMKARNIYRCTVIPGNEACGPSLALDDNRRISWQKSWLLLHSACCPSKPIFDWHLCPTETGITPSEWALCQASRWVWAKACQKPSMWIKFKYQGPKLPSRDIKTAVCWELFVLKVKGHAISTPA